MDWVDRRANRTAQLHEMQADKRRTIELTEPSEPSTQPDQRANTQYAHNCTDMLGMQPLGHFDGSIKVRPMRRKELLSDWLNALFLRRCDEHDDNFEHRGQAQEIYIFRSIYTPLKGHSHAKKEASSCLVYFESDEVRGQGMWVVQKQWVSGWVRNTIHEHQKPN